MTAAAQWHTSIPPSTCPNNHPDARQQTMNNPKIPYLSLKDITSMHMDEILQAVTRVTAGGWYLHGEETRLFEQEYARYTGYRHCIGCGNGLDALTMILRAYMEHGKIAPGDEIIVPANTYIASILAISECGLTPVLVEPRADNFQIDSSRIDAALTERTRGVMIVHLYGYNAYDERIGQICRERGLILVEDCAQAHGLLRQGAREGMENCAAYSFYPGKNLGALGDAGCVVTDNEQIAETVRMIGNYGSAEKYVFRYKGRNSRIDEIQAAVLRVKLRYLDADNARRKAIAHRYISEITNDAVVMPPEGGVFHIFAARCGHRDRLMAHLASQGISTMIHYPVPPHKQQAYAEWNTMTLPVTELIHREEISLPCNQAMTDDECAYVISTINSFMP